MESYRPEPGQPRVIFHIGAEKTGTTSFQRFCLENQAELRGQGVLYPTASFAFGKNSRNHAPLVAAYLNGAVEPDYSVAKVWRRREETLASLFAEIDGAANAHTVLLSAEHFSSRFGADQINELSRDFTRFRPKIVIVFRSHLEWLYSLYSTIVRNGSCWRYDDLVQRLHSAGIMVAYRLIVEKWAAAFGKENLTLLHLPEGRDVTNLLTRAGVVPALPGRRAQSYRDNIGHGPLVIEALRQTNELVETRARRPASTYFQHRLADIARTKILERLVAVVGQEGANPPNSLICSDPDLQHSLESAIAEDEDWLRRNFGYHFCAPQRRCATSSPEIEKRPGRLMKQLGFMGRNWLRIALFARGGFSPTRPD
jgi:hypothetical protein